ncbi:hypothetical protein [Clostridium magnum]|uniref:Uncharacterized protein n=1 Tax=Clostridium magnum DSM 2767 TaxID=1121326 RepID=A0A162QM07_9CLOT|nr:hypothetical protein [Clostridium magnum]KZL88695.1 hypothetical protein CLMAG_59840 [Clostridium magnum DSM 2767]SHJ64107.1 hypothetical protein SAMN02745944_06275 [Clostridium magnum DSM 2767]
MGNSIGNMTLNEAIDHCREIIRKSNSCDECINQHAQLLLWLEELKNLREFKRKIVEAVKS